MTRLAPNGRPGSTVFRLYDVAAGVLVAEATQDAGDDLEAICDALWAVCEHLVTDGEIVLAAFDGATGWGLPIGDRPLIFG